ncbi:filamentous hemagglutinin N-terminal domain-containing protein [Calothrix membranacea FACHB-236]|nr:filamentous hemagglutinin N-terminal domain-containing protein [Calothrix membranacea FACHB-236]
MSNITFGKANINKGLIIIFALKNYKSSLFLSLICALCGWLLLDGLQTKAIAQITPNPNDANTVVNQTDNTFNIQGGTQTGTNLFHSFEKFGLNQGQTANFISNPSIQNILGRVTGGEASVINGLIQVTGGNSNLFLINPAGMIFGPNASLNVPAAFTATTANAIGFNNQWFNAVGTNNYSNLTGNPDAFAFTQPGGAIINHGNLSVSSGQSLTLLGGTVINTGTVESAAGTININAVPGEKLVTITPKGSLLSLGLPVEAKTAINALPFTPQSLPQLLTGGNVNVATGVTVENGVVKLTGSGVTIPNTPGTTVVANNINVSGQTGGNVNILGNIVGLVDANINASGTNGGGTVLIGGDYQGKGTVPNASQTFISSNSTINADAIENGNGGRVIAWADGTTRFYGNISARGGNSSGDGGFVEVSGKDSLTFDGFVNVGATNGKVGQLLLDPASVVISFVGADDNELNDRQILFANNPGGSFSISNTKIIDSLKNGDVTIEATNDITINSSFEAFQNSNKLTLNAPNIDISGSQNISVRGDLNLIGNNLTITDDQLTSTQGNLNITAQTLTTQNSQLFAQENLNLITQGNLNLQGTELSSLGNIFLQSNNAINLSETVNPSITRTTGKISIQGNGGINIQALNLPESLLRSGGDFSLISDGNIIGNARIASGGNFSVAGTGTYSQPNPTINFNGIISSSGNVSFGDYTGSSLKVEAGGNIKAGNINITKAGSFPTGSDPDLAILNTGPAVILRAGVTNLKYSPDNPAGRTFEGTAFTFPNGELPTTTTLPGSIQVGDITTAETPVALPTRKEFETAGSNLFPANSVILSAAGEIKTGNITTKKGSINLTTTNGNIFVDSINTLGLNPITGEGQSTTDSGANITVDAGGIFIVQKTFPFGFAPDSSIKFPTSILTSRFSGNSQEGTNATINIKHRGVDFIAGYGNSNIAADVSGTAGGIFISEGSNQQLGGSYNDPNLPLSNSIGVSQVPRPGQPEQPQPPNPDIPDDAQRQLTRQPSQNDICQPTNTGLTLAQKLKQARRVSVNSSTSGGANTCEGATQDNNLLQINQDNRTQPVRINLNPVPQSRMNHHS